jgi:hypothetical protein
MSEAGENSIIQSQVGSTDYLYLHLQGRVLRPWAMVLDWALEGPTGCPETDQSIELIQYQDQLAVQLGHAVT